MRTIRRFTQFIGFSLGLLSSNLSAYPGLSVWDVLTQQFALNHEISRPEVQAQIHWLLQHRNYLQQLTRSEPYMYHIVTEIHKRHLPGELALIPMVESAYNPLAYSGAGAAGLWQIMPGTGNDLGLRQDWWYDGRRSIASSTGAALSYLDYLHRVFHGNWTLAFAAYDAGEGAIAKSIKNSHQAPEHASFWLLSVPKETRAYVPRILALAEIIQHAQQYHIHLPAIPHVPYFQEVTLGTQIDLDHAAQLAEISYQDLLKLNPGYNRWRTAPNQPYKLLIPTRHIARFEDNLSQLSTTQKHSWIRYRVQPGDTLQSIAAQQHTSIAVLKSLNQLRSDSVPKGQYILIPTANYEKKPVTKVTHFTKPTHYKIIYIVDKNDDFEKIAQKFHISTAQIRHWNNLSEQDTLAAKQTIILWRPARNPLYVVKKGDSLTRIALSHHTSLQKLLSLNPSMRHSQLQSGQVLKLPI